MKQRMFVIPFVAALLGGGIVVAVMAAFGGLGEKTTTVTQVQAAAPAQPSNASHVSVGLTPHQVYVKDAPGVAFVTSTIVQKGESPFNLFGGESQKQGTATGSGIVIDSNGTILTNYHVVENAIKVTVSFGKGKSIEAQVVGKDPSNDLAVLRIHPEGVTLHPLTLGDSSAVTVGDPVYAIGNPFDLERTLTTGVISALQRQITAPNGFTINNVLQTDAPINPGNSGGPLLDTAGRVIGINSQIISGGSGSGNVGIGFAVPIDTAKKLLPQLKQSGSVVHAYLGITGATIDASLADLQLKVDRGVLVQTVEPRGPAATAGLRGGTVDSQVNGARIMLGGDVIQSFDGRTIGSMSDLTGDIASHKPGDRVSVGILRSGSAKQLTVTLGTAPRQAPGQTQTTSP